jgi:fumarate reductase flavoprotein subunit
LTEKRVSKKLLQVENKGEMPEKMWSFEVPPPPIPAKEIKEAISTEVVVVGAGMSGMAAALSAAEAGASTVLLEKHSTYIAHGIENGAINSRLQKKLGIEIDPGRVLADMVRWAGNKIDQRLVMLWASQSGGVMDWLLDMAEAQGLEAILIGNFDDDQCYRQYPTSHIIGGTGRGVVVGMMEGNARKHGVDIRYKTPAVQLLREKEGRVTGVIARTAEGDYIQFNASKGVVLCTGDYGNDLEMIRRYCPQAENVDKNGYAPAVNTGDGHKMGLWIGAAMQQVEPHAPMIHTLGVPPPSNDPFLRVNALGERYENEDVPMPYICNGIQGQPGNISWMVFDAKWEEDITRMGKGFARDSVANDWTKDRFQKAVESGSLLHADTIEELAQKMQVPVETFRATVERYNELARMGKDLDFGKIPERLTTIVRAPYYATRMPVVLLAVVGGLDINTRMQVLDTEKNVIPGLYAAGNVSGNFFANDYPCMCPGLSHGRALTFGRMAGLNAAAEQP